MADRRGGGGVVGEVEVRRWWETRVADGGKAREVEREPKGKGTATGKLSVEGNDGGLGARRQEAVLGGDPGKTPVSDSNVEQIWDGGIEIGLWLGEAAQLVEQPSGSWRGGVGGEVQPGGAPIGRHGGDQVWREWRSGAGRGKGAGERVSRERRRRPRRRRDGGGSRGEVLGRGRLGRGLLWRERDGGGWDWGRM